MLAVVPPRAPADDVLICRRHESFEELPAGVVVGTSSTRRRAQLLRLRPDLHVKDIRGNVPTRLRKLDHGEYDALILAEAGLQRLGLGDRITQRMPFPMFLPAVGQGALGLEVRAGDQGVMTQIAPLDDSDTHLAVLAERAMLASLHGGCLAPVAGYAHVDHHRLILVGRVLSHDGSELLEASLVESLSVAAPDVSNGNRETAETLGRRVADALLSQGAAKLIQAARRV
jgi:hydroxymethylbilane synthase